MAFAKIQKQLNIANQLITEKVFNGEKSKFNDDFTEMEKKTDATADLIDDLQQRTKEFLQPNPAARAKMAALKLSSSGQAKSQYPQTEGILGNAMVNHGKKLGEDNCLGQALMEAGDSLKQIADVKYSLDNNVKQNFLDPLNHLQNNDLKEVMHHRKKLSNRRLDFDGKRRKMGRGTTEEEVRMAQEKFKESLHNASTSMYHLLENDVELISQLCVFSESLMQYYQSCADIMQDLTNKLYEKKSEAMNRPKKDFIPTSLSDLNIDSISLGSNSDRHNNNSNGASLYNLERSKATSSFNLASHKSSSQNIHNNNFSRTSKAYGSQSNISGKRNSYQSVNSFNINSPTTPGIDRWEQAWEDDNNFVRAPSYHQQQKQQHREHFPLAKNSNQSVKHSHSAYDFKRASNNQNQMSTSNRSVNHYVDDPFDDPWSVKPTISNPIPMNTTQQSSTVNLINNFNNNYRSQSSAFPHCVALYDFEAENAGELSFKENDIIRLVNKVDENWFEGTVNGRTGYFPQSYVSPSEDPNLLKPSPTSLY
ncbi:CLUMA_CG008316, isoform A [Clunio marinus]|uniref:Endophilin-A n=1 Tax=Clunio marinus TaxID=568069 RepID=A0A1J1I797_9DIPT|nr:CLUMA_CG008316, isoform A [Clunio marinus]